MEVMGNKREIQAFLKTQKGPWEMFTEWKECIQGKAKSLEDKICMFVPYAE